MFLSVEVSETTRQARDEEIEAQSHLKEMRIQAADQARGERDEFKGPTQQLGS